MDFVAVVDQVIALLRQRGRVTYRTLPRQFSQMPPDCVVKFRPMDIAERILW